MFQPDRARDRTAPWYSIPAREIVTVEHPCVVQNIDKGIQTLDGNGGISRASKTSEHPFVLPIRT